MTTKSQGNRDDHSNDPLLDRKAAARFLKFSPNTLAAWDSSGRYNLGPIRIGRNIRYRKSNLEKFLNERYYLPE